MSFSSDNLLTALVAGTSAAAVSGTLTYPFDSLKTQQQLINDRRLAKFNLQPVFASSLAQLYKGGSALVIGCIAKNSARLILYNWLSQFMSIEAHDAHGDTKRRTSAPRMVIAGAMSGFIETLFIVPFENIKITMVQNMILKNEIKAHGESITGVSHKHTHKSGHNIFAKQYVSPHAYYTSEIYNQYRGKPASKFNPRSHSSIDTAKLFYNKHPSETFLGTIKEIYTLKRLRGFTAGTCITIIRQSAISGVWLSTYNFTRQLLDPHGAPGEASWFGHKHTVLQLVGLHLFSSLAVVAVTQPIDVVKSHIQLKNGKLVYKDSLSTAFKLFVEQGPWSLARGALPRGLKILVNGGLTAGIYEIVEKGVGVASGQTVFKSE